MSLNLSCVIAQSIYVRTSYNLLAYQESGSLLLNNLLNIIVCLMLVRASVLDVFRIGMNQSSLARCTFVILVRLVLSQTYMIAMCENVVENLTFIGNIHVATCTFVRCRYFA